MKEWNYAKHSGLFSFLVALIAAFHNSFSFMIYTKSSMHHKKLTQNIYIR